MGVACLCLQVTALLDGISVIGNVSQGQYQYVAMRPQVPVCFLAFVRACVLVVTRLCRYFRLQLEGPPFVDVQVPRGCCVACVLACARVLACAHARVILGAHKLWRRGLNDRWICTPCPATRTSLARSSCRCVAWLRVVRAVFTPRDVGPVP
jgi:hypothetical protein